MSKFCQHCGKETDDSATFCSNCGTRFYSEEIISENNTEQKIYISEEKPKKNKNKIIILVAIIILFIIGIALFGSGNSNNSENNTNSGNNTITISDYSDSNSRSNSNNNYYTKTEKTYYAYQVIMEGRTYDIDLVGAFSYITLNSSNDKFSMYLDFNGETSSLYGEYSYYSTDEGITSYLLYDGSTFFGILAYDPASNSHFVQIDDTDVILAYK